MERCRIVFSGSGGQGVISAAIIFAEACVLFENLNAVQSQVYGPAARGGAARSDIIISDSQINFPRVIQANLLVCLTQEAYNNYCAILRPGGTLVTDDHYVKTQKQIDARQIELPMYKTALDVTGKKFALNMCMLGVVSELTHLVKPESLEKSIATRFPSNVQAINQKALELGIDMARGKL